MKRDKEGEGDWEGEREWVRKIERERERERENEWERRVKVNKNEKTIKKNKKTFISYDMLQITRKNSLIIKKNIKPYVWPLKKSKTSKHLKNILNDTTIKDKTFLSST